LRYYRFQPEGVHGVSQVVALKFAWTDQKWTNIARDDVVIYELHLGKEKAIQFAK
jgi:maltooligosyltrehalose trehalohydrolase